MKLTRYYDPLIRKDGDTYEVDLYNYLYGQSYYIRTIKSNDVYRLMTEVHYVIDLAERFKPHKKSFLSWLLFWKKS